jgi:RHS repeat-associated protein
MRWGRRSVGPLLSVLLLGGVALVLVMSAAASTDYPTTVLGDSPSAYWRLGEASGTSFADSSGHGYTLTLTPPTSPSGVAGTNGVTGDVSPDDGAYGFNFDNSGLRYVAPTYYDFDANGQSLAPRMQATVTSGYPSGTNAYTFEAWVKPTSESSSAPGMPEQIIGNVFPVTVGGCLENKALGTSLYYLQPKGNADGAFVFERDAGQCPNLTTQAYSVPVAPGQWYYVVGTYDGATMRLFVDGQLVTQQPVSNFSIGTGTSQQTIRVGNGVPGYNTDVSGDHFKGTIDEAAVYNYALSGGQISAHYSYGLSSGNTYSNPPPIPPTQTPVSLPTYPNGEYGYCGGFEPNEWVSSNFYMENYRYYQDEGYYLLAEATNATDPFVGGGGTWLGSDNNYVLEDNFSGYRTYGWQLLSNADIAGTPINWSVSDSGCNDPYATSTVNIAFSWLYAPPLAQENGCDAAVDGVNDASFFGDVNSLSGAYATGISDVKMPGLGVPLSFSRCYSSAFSNVSGPLGPGWKDSFSANLSIDGFGNALFTSETGQQLLYYKNADGSYTAPAGYSTLTQNGDGTYTLTRVNGTSYHFNSSGQPLTETDRNGEGLTFNYTGGQLTSVTDQTGRTATLSYNGNLVSLVSYSDGRSVSFGYTGGLLTLFTDVRGKVWHYAYDAGNRLASIQDPLGHYSIRNTYDSATGRVTSQQDANNQTRTISFGSGTTLTDPNHKTWTDTYKNNELVSRTDPLGDKYTYTYDANGNRLTSTDPNGNKTTYTYDANGNMLSQAAPASLGYQPQTWTYNSKNEVASHTDARGHETDYNYDPAGNLTSIVKPGNLTTTYNRNPSNPDMVDSMVNARGKTTHYSYDANGNLASVTDPDGNQTSYTYDSAGNRLTLTTPRGNVSGCGCASQYTTTYTYDNAGHKLSATDPLGNKTTYTYDDAGNRASMVDPLGNVNGCGCAAQHTTSYGYDNANELTSITRPGSQPSAIGYNNRGLVSSRTSPLGRQTTYFSDEAGRLTSVVSPNGNVTGCNCASQYTTSYAYDANGNRIQVTNPLGGVTKTAYDQLNRRSDTTVYRPKQPATYASTILADSPSTYWRLDESSGSMATNLGSDGSSKNGTYSGATLGQAGATNDTDTAISSGSVSATRYAIPSSPSSTLSVSFEGWFNLSAQPASYSELFGNGDGNASTGGYGLWAWTTQTGCTSASSGNYMVGVFVSGATNCALQAQVSLNAWHYIALTHSGPGTTGTWSLYLDGVLQSSVTSSGASTGAIQHTPSTGSLYVSASSGSADEPAFYASSTLSATQVANHYTAGAQRGTTALVTSYTYDANGNVTRIVGPTGRTTTKTYDANNQLLSSTLSTTGLEHYLQATVGTNPNGYWRMDESSGTTANNIGSDGSSENGTYSGSSLQLNQPGALAGSSDTAMYGGEFTAPTYSVPNCSSLSACNATIFNATMEGWFYATNAPGSGPTPLYTDGTPFGSDYGYGLYEWGLSGPTGCNGNSSNAYYTVGLWVSGDPFCVLQATISTKQWHFIAVTHTGPAGANGVWSLYIDGSLRGSVTSTSTATGEISHVPTDGLNAYGGLNVAFSTMDELDFFSSTALSASQISAQYAAGLQNVYSATILGNSPNVYWRLDESAGSTATNLGSDVTSKNGTYNGATLGQAGVTNDGDTALSGGTVSTGLYALPTTPSGTLNASFEGWFNLSSQPASYSELQGNGDSNASTGGYGLWAWTTQSGCNSASSGNYMVGLFVSGATNCALQAQVSLNAWHHIALTHSGAGTTGIWSLYVDGNLISSVTSTGPSTGAIQHVPSSGSLLASAAQGTIDEPAFYSSSTLSAAQILNDYNAAQAAAALTTSYTYDNDGNVTSVTDPRGGETTYSYDDADLLQSKVSPLGNVNGCGCASQYTTTYGYDPDGNQKTVTDPLNHPTTTNYNADQQPINVTDPANRETQRQYDANGNLTATIANDNSTVMYGYNALNQLTSKTTGMTSPSCGCGNTTTYFPDNDGMLTKVVDPLSPGGTTTYTYDADGNRLTTEDAIANAAQNPALGTTTYTYNALDQPTQISYSDGTPTVSYSYDSQGDLLSRKDAAGKTSYGYNNNSQVTSAWTGPAGFSYGYDGYGNLTSETYPNGTSLTDQYDNDGNLTSMSSGGQTTSYVYDPNNQLTSESLPNGYTATMVYDHAGQLSSLTNANGPTTLSSYAVTGRYNDGAPQTLSATNNNQNWVENYTYDQNGRLASVCYQATCPNGSDPKIGWTYDPSGNRISETRANGVATAYSYNAADELKTAVKTGPGIPNPYSTTVQADGASPYFRLGETSGSSFLSTPSGFTGTWTGSPTLNVTGALNGDSSGAVKLNGSSQYGNVPNATGFNKSNNFTVELWIKRSGSTGTLQAIAGKPLTATTKSENYAIWLTTGNKVEFQVGAGNKSQTLDSSGTITDTTNWHYIVATFASGVMKLYVDNGTPTTVTASFTSASTNTSTFDVGRAGTTNYFNGSIDELALYPSVLSATQVNTHYTQATSVPSTTTNYTYNKDGEETAAGNASYSWNLAGELTTATIGGPTSTYTYDGAGMRTSAATGGPTINYTWDEALGGLPTLASETDGSGNPLRTYLYGASTSPVSMTTPGGSYYDSYDAYGNVADQTSLNGATQWAYSYEPFGIVRNATNVSGNAPTNPYQYAGQYTDTVTALSDMRARTYDPNTGAFLTTDPAGQSTPQVSTQYGYAGDLPLMYSDPSGLHWWNTAENYISQGLDYLDQAPSAVASAVNTYVVQPTIQAAQNDVSCVGGALGGSFRAGACISGAIGTAMFLLPEARTFTALTDIAGGLAFRAAARAAGTDLGQAATSSLFRLATEETGSLDVGAFTSGAGEAAAQASEGSLSSAERTAAGAGASSLPVGDVGANLPGVVREGSQAEIDGANTEEALVGSGGGLRPSRAKLDDQNFGGLRFFRGANPGEEPSFMPRPNEFRVDPETGFVRGTHGVSVFNNPGSVASRGYEPYEVNMSSVPDELTLIQRGQDLTHYEIVPAPGVGLTPEDYITSLLRIETW